MQWPTFKSRLLWNAGILAASGSCLMNSTNLQTSPWTLQMIQYHSGQNKNTTLHFTRYIHCRNIHMYSLLSPWWYTWLFSLLMIICDVNGMDSQAEVVWTCTDSLINGHGRKSTPPPPPPHTHTIIEQTHNTPKHNSTHTHTLCLDGLSINSQQKTLTEIIDSLSPWQIPLGKQKHLKTKTKRQQTVPFVQPGLLQLIREVMDAKDGAVTPVLIKISQLLVPNFEVLVSGWHALCHCLRERKNPRKTGKKRQSHSGVTCPVSLPERNEKHV